jgi:hypothetical protein
LDEATVMSLMSPHGGNITLSGIFMTVKARAVALGLAQHNALTEVRPYRLTY